MKGLQKITDLDKKVDRDNLIYKYKGRTVNAKFDKFDDALKIINKIRNGNVKNKSNQFKSNQINRFKSNLSEVKKAHKNRTKEQEDTLYNIEMFYKARNEAIKFHDDYSSRMSETELKATKGTGLKILISKQMLQRLPIALAQVKAGNNSEDLLNEIRQIVYSLYQSKEIIRKEYNNIIKSIQ